MMPIVLTLQLCEYGAHVVGNQMALDDHNYTPRMSIRKGGVKMSVDEAAAVRYSIFWLLDKLDAQSWGGSLKPNDLMKELWMGGGNQHIPMKEGPGGAPQIPVGVDGLYLQGELSKWNQREPRLVGFQLLRFGKKMDRIIVTEYGLRLNLMQV